MSQPKQDILLRLIMENVRDYAIFILDMQRNVISWNAGAERITGYCEQEILGQSADILFTPEDRAEGAPDQEMRTAFTNGRAEDERWHLRKDSTRFWASGILTALRDDGDQLQGYAKILRDMTARKEAEEQQLNISALLLEQERHSAVLEERNRIAQEVHDTLAQGFVGIALHLDAADNALAERKDGSLETLRTYIAQARASARECIREARRSINALRPEQLEGRSLPEALEGLLVRVAENAGTQTEFRLQGVPYPLLAIIEDTLFRIGQEAITNVVKHANAKQVKMELRYQDDRVELSIRDDGLGFDVHQVMNTEGFGLKGMQHRVERIRSILHIDSQIGQGTEITATVNVANIRTREEVK